MPHYQPTDVTLLRQIQDIFDTNAEGWRMTTEEIINHLRTSGFRLGDSRRAQEMQIARVLGQIGVHRAKSIARQGYEGIRLKKD